MPRRSTTPSHQSARLGKGRHASPEEGVCVMELASLLAGEPFSDRPESACPVIAALLRTYNDAVDDRRRRDLYRYAAAVVGTRAGVATTGERAARVRAWTDEATRALPPLKRWLGRRPRPVDGARPFAVERVGVAAAQVAARSRSLHEPALALLDDLIAMGETNEGLLPPRFDVADLAPQPRTTWA